MRPVSPARTVMAAALAVAIAGVLLAASCKRQPPSGPPRPAGVPAGAFWVGGPDGGVFVLLEPPGAPEAGKAGKNRLRGKVYRPDGDVWFSGEFAVEPAGASIDVSDRRLFNGWDGERLLLADGRSLRAIEAP